MTTNAALCALDHDAEHEKQAAQPLVVCAWHQRRIRRAVTETPARYAALATRLVPTGSSTVGRTSGSRDVGISINPLVAQLRTDIRNTVSTWARIAVEERGMTTPDSTIPAICDFLVKQLDWYLAQPWTRQFANDMTENWQHSGSLIEGNPVRTFEVADCPEPGCGGKLYARLRPKDSLLPHDITCAESPIDDDGQPTHYWTADRWRTLGRHIRKAAM